MIGAVYGLLAQDVPTFSSWGDYWQQSWWLWLSAMCVIAIYSYLFKDNAIYRTIIQIFIGISIGYNVVVLWQEVLKPQWWLPMRDGFFAVFFHQPGSPWGLLWAVVGILGLLWYFQLSRKYLWLSRIVIGLTVGIGAGLTYESLFGQNMPQVIDSFRPLAPSIVGPRPVRRFSLPPAVVPPAFADPLIYVADDRQVVAIEALQGQRVWRAPMEEKPTRGLFVVDDDLIVLTAKSEIHFDRSTGAAKPTQPNPGGQTIAVLKAGDRIVRVGAHGVGLRVGDKGNVGLDSAPDLAGATVTSACVMPKLLDAQGKEHDVLFLAAGGKPMAVDTPSGKVLWARVPGATADAVYDGGLSLLAVQNGKLQVLDPSTGTVTKSVAPGGSVGAASVAHMSQPTQDQMMAIVPLHETAVGAIMMKDDGATARKAGELLWKYETHVPIIWTGTVDGILLAAGPQGGSCMEIPEAQQRMSVQDFTDNWVFILALLSVMTYFFFSFKRMTGKGVSQFSMIGRWTLMIGFGAIFGNTIMTRMSFLLDRLMFLHDEWLIPFWYHILHMFGR